jgi:hypothetical protein
MTPSESALHGRIHAVAIEVTFEQAGRQAEEDGSEAVQGRVLCRRRRVLDWLRGRCALCVCMRLKLTLQGALLPVRQTARNNLWLYQRRGPGPLRSLPNGIRPSSR